MPKPKILLLAALVLSSAAWAEDDEIATDRPDFVESSNVVGKGRFQIETSLAWERDKVDGVRIKGRATPTLLRLGVSDNLELRVETDGRVRVSGPGGSVSGTADTAVGVKWHVADAAGGSPSMALLFHADLDSGSRAFRGQGTRPSVRLVAEWEFAGDWSAGVMPGVFQERNEEGRKYTGLIASAVVGKGLSEQWRVFAEIAASQIASKKNGGNVATLDLGTAYLVTPTAQLDFAVQRGLNRNSPDLAWTVGFSIKF
jgi:hypothetical protein